MHQKASKGIRKNRYRDFSMFSEKMSQMTPMVKKTSEASEVDPVMVGANPIKIKKHMESGKMYMNSILIIRLCRVLLRILALLWVPSLREDTFISMNTTTMRSHPIIK